MLSDHLISTLICLKRCTTVLKIADLLLFVLVQCKLPDDETNREIQNISKSFHSWIKHPNVVGGSCFGGTETDKYEIEYNVS